MIYTIYRIKVKSMPRAITVVGVGYEITPSTGILRVFDRHREGGQFSNHEVFASAHGCWEWIRKIGERDE